MVVIKLLEKLNDLLSFIDFEAHAYSKNGFPVFTVTDLQGANYGDIESECFLSPSAVVGRLEIYFDDIFLDGDVCCDEPTRFISYEEALDACLSKGYNEMARGIELLLSY